MSGGKIPSHIASEAAAQAVRDARERANRYPPEDATPRSLGQRLDALEARVKALEAKG